MADRSVPTEHLGQQALESYLWGAANLLRGLIDAGDYKQYVFPLLFFKRLSDVWDEAYRSALDETGDAGYAQATADDRFTIPAGARRCSSRGRASASTTRPPAPAACSSRRWPKCSAPAATRGP